MPLMNKFLFNIFYGFVWLITWLPLGVLYRISDLIFVLMYYVIRYRRKVVWNNLSNAFPEKTDKEKRTISRKFFLHLCDYFIETIKLMHLSEKEIARRIEYDNTYLKEHFKENKNLIGLIGHNANWEWLTAVCTQDEYHWVAPYHPLQSSPLFDKFMLELRSRFGPEPVPMKNTYRRLVEISKTDELFIAGMIADQSPPNANNRRWIDFLNQDTAVMEGPERIAQKINASVVFCKMSKIKRGYYKIEMIPVTENVNEEEDFAITRRYYEMLEDQIKEQPEYWLWSHRRWKRQRPEDSRLVKN